jgi:hypothetical protein
MGKLKGAKYQAGKKMPMKSAKGHPAKRAAKAASARKGK